MPIYAYRCSACGHAQDVLQKISDPLLSVCPACAQPTYTKQVTAAGFQLKGSGWYVTDFRDGAKGAKGGADKDAASAADKGADSAGDKAADKTAEKTADKAPAADAGVAKAGPSAPAPAAAKPAAPTAGA